MSKLSSIQLIERIKPELSSLPIRKARIDMNTDDVAVLNVELVVTDELLSKLVKKQDVTLTIAGVKAEDLYDDTMAELSKRISDYWDERINRHNTSKPKKPTKEEYPMDRYDPHMPKPPKPPKARSISEDKRNQLKNID